MNKLFSGQANVQSPIIRDFLNTTIEAKALEVRLQQQEQRIEGLIQKLDAIPKFPFSQPTCDKILFASKLTAGAVAAVTVYGLTQFVMRFLPRI